MQNKIITKIRRDIKRYGLRGTARMIGMSHSTLYRLSVGLNIRGGYSDTWERIKNYYGGRR